MNRSRCLDAVVALAVEVDVVVRRVVVAVGQLARDEAEELVLDLIGDRIADHREIRPVLVDHVLDQRVVGLLPVLTLLDVGLLAHDAGLEHGEVAGLRGREALGDEVLERAGEAALAPAVPRRDRARDAGVEEADVREVGIQPLDLDQERAGLAVQRVGRVERDLDVGPLALFEVADGVVAALGLAEQHAVVLASGGRCGCRRCRR